MRDRLIELLGSFPTFGERTLADKWMPEAVERLAGHLLAEGVIVPPCKTKQKVYVIGNIGIREAIVSEMCFSGDNDISIILCFDLDYDCEKCPFSSWHQGSCGQCTCGYWGVRIDDFGKTVFLTKEEAEKALAERRVNEV